MRAFALIGCKGTANRGQYKINPDLFLLSSAAYLIKRYCKSRTIQKKIPTIIKIAGIFMELGITNPLNFIT